MSGIPPLEQGKFVAVLPFRVLGDAQTLEQVAEGLNEALSTKLFQLAKKMRPLRHTREASASILITGFCTIELGNAYFSIGQNEKALEEFKRVIELEPENVTGWNDLAGAYERMGRYPESIPAYRKSIELAPTWLAYSNLGYVYTVLKQYPRAIQALKKSIELGPNQELPVGNLADAYRYSGQKDKADAIYDKAIALAFRELQVNPQSADAMGDLAVYYAKKGESMRASEFIRRARGIDKKDVELIFSQATVENLANRPSDSIRTLRDAMSNGYPVQEVESNPDFDNLKNRTEFQALIKGFDQPAK
jgi:eukaryotic-like serine/threonine-protein kinase